MMQIDQHNYETFFLMYVDNELSAAQKEMVDAFVGRHPELAIELKLLQQTVSGHDEHIRFGGAEKLKRQAAFTEEALLTYLDGEAAPELAKSIQDTISSSEILQREVKLLERLYLKEDGVVSFPAKKALYKRASINIPDWSKFAIAASLLACISTWIFLYKTADDIVTPVAVNIVEERPRPVVKAPAGKVPDTIPAAAQAIVRQSPSPAQPVSVKPVLKTQEENTGPGSVTARAVITTGAKPQAADNGAGQNAGKEGETTSHETHEPPAEKKVVASPPVEQPTTIAAENTRGKEKGSLFKKIGKKIGDRALDILTDGGNDVTVAGFVINVRN